MHNPGAGGENPATFAVRGGQRGVRLPGYGAAQHGAQVTGHGARLTTTCRSAVTRAGKWNSTPAEWRLDGKAAGEASIHGRVAPCHTAGDSARLISWRYLAVRIAATLAANVAHGPGHGLGHGPVGAVVAAWPAVALVGSYELLMMIIRGAQAS